MPTTLIQQNPSFDKKVESASKLAIAELFCDTIQGEGASVGVLSTFLRLQGCTLKCVWCDTLDVWPNGNEYTFEEIFRLFESVGLIEKFRKGQHLILTGGSPLKQQEQLVDFIRAFKALYKFKPYIEIENEAVLIPSTELSQYIDQWNNSPKLANSGMKEKARVKPLALQIVRDLPNSWFKFVVNSEADWQEIQETFIETGLVRKNQIILMPEGQTQEELAITRPIAAELAIKVGVRFTDRLHVTIWDRKTGV